MSKPEELAAKAKEAADKLDQLNERVNGKESAAETADRLAKKQKANADEQDKKKDQASTAEARKKAGVEAVVFDRNGFPYHGRIAAVADAAREAGLKF